MNRGGNKRARGSRLIGLGGGSCAGKTTLAKKVRARLLPVRSEILTCDRYYKPLDHLPFEERQRQNFDSLSMLDLPLLGRHLRQLKAGLSVEVPVYDFHRHTRSSQTEVFNPLPVILVEGILIFASERLLRLLDLKVYIDVDDDLRLARRIKRDRAERRRSPESVLRQYFATVLPAHKKLVEPTRALSDLVIRGEGETREAVDRVVARIKTLLNLNFSSGKI
ncbi:MAG: uridine kinase [Candidatus Euphemobacter frigidus]|nr:uridine kinase [Candidatus Euphemobacter frigidus]MDP8276770.1 uridine kinase [Candidatus Euphemobacter frigidus]